jgi:hypothetical protein
MKFATMWANHTWGNYFPYPYDAPFHVLLPIRHSGDDFERAIRYHIDHYFNQPNYWRVDGGLYFSIFAPEQFVKQLGGPEATRKIIDAARKQVADAGLGELHLAGFTGYPPSAEPLKAAGFDSITNYNVTTSSLGLGQPQHPTVPYDTLITGSETFWDNMDIGTLPYAPAVTVGWDVTYRWEKDTPWPPQKGHYPYTPVIVDNTPEKFGQMLRAAQRHAADSSNNAPYILINAWNEWTEGSALLPSTIHGDGYLKQLKAATEAPMDSDR